MKNILDIFKSKESVDALLPVMSGVDLIGIWLGDVLYNTNSAGKKLVFTETFSL